MSVAPMTQDGTAFLHLMKRYVVDYTNSHDQAQTETIMEPDYLLRMGEHQVRGRDGDYAAATRRQLDQFPGLGLTVHEIWTSGERLAMRFSEHGASLRHAGALASWGGIGLYRWNGSRLTANNVEQDYVSRARQLASGEPLGVEPPAVAPWDTPVMAPDTEMESAVRDWLQAGRLGQDRMVICDDAWAGPPMPRIVDQTALDINDLFSCGSVVAFHVSQHGNLLADFAPTPTDIGRRVTLYSAGIVHLDAAGTILSGRVIRNRIDLQRSLKTKMGIA